MYLAVNNAIKPKQTNKLYIYIYMEVNNWNESDY